MKPSKSKHKRILNAVQIKVILERFAREMTKAYGNLDQIVFIGIRTRGPYVAKRLAEFIRKRHGKEIPVGEMDITLSRDSRQLVDWLAVGKFAVAIADDQGELTCTGVLLAPRLVVTAAHCVSIKEARCRRL